MQDTAYPGAKSLLMQVFRALWEMKNGRRWVAVGPAERSREADARRRLAQLRAQQQLPPVEENTGLEVPTSQPEEGQADEVPPR